MAVGTAGAASGSTARGKGKADAAEASSSRWVLLVALILTAVMEVLDTTIVNVALPQMAGNVGATTQEIGNVSTSYILANVIVLPMTAFLAGWLGRKRYLIGSLIVFTIASFLCGISTSLPELVLWRLLQGAGGAALLSTAQATLRQVFPKEEQPLVQALFLIGIVVGPTVGPTLGGVLTDNYSWHWCFFINIPVGIGAVALISLFMHDPPNLPRYTADQIDWPGVLLLALGLGSLQYVLDEGQQDDWFADPWIVRLTIIAVVSLITLIWWLLTPRNPHPIVDFAVLKNRDLAAAIFLFTALGFGLYGGIYLFPLVAQRVLGQTPTTTGFALLPGGLMTAVAAMVCSRLLNGIGKFRVDARLLIFLGGVIYCVSLWQLAHLSASSGLPDTRFALLFRGLGLGFLFTPINQAAFAKVDPKDAPQASSLMNLARQMGGSFGIALLATYVANHEQAHRVNLLRTVYRGNPALEARLQQITGGLIVRGGYLPGDAKRAALRQLDLLVNRQAALQSYNDAFLLVMIVFLCTMPAILLLRKSRGGSAAQGMH